MAILINLLIFIVLMYVVWLLGNWLLNMIGAPAPIVKAFQVIFAVICFIELISIVFGHFGVYGPHGFIG